MEVRDLPLAGLKLIQLKLWRDERGFFTERYQEKRFREAGLPTHFVQDNHSRSIPGTIRGLHFQWGPKQGKLIGCSRGKILDVAVDVRPKSPTFGQHHAVELDGDSGLLFWIPAGFAHGFIALGDEPSDVLYKTDGLYEPKAEGGIRWNDPALKIQWPKTPGPFVSPKDQILPTLAEAVRQYPLDLF